MFRGLPSECRFIYLYIIKSPIEAQTINLGTREVGSKGAPGVALVPLHQSTIFKNDCPSRAEREARFGPNSPSITSEASSTFRKRERARRFAMSSTSVQSRTTSTDSFSTSSLFYSRTENNDYPSRAKHEARFGLNSPSVTLESSSTLSEGARRLATSDIPMQSRTTSTDTSSTSFLFYR